VIAVADVVKPSSGEAVHRFEWLGWIRCCLLVIMKLRRVRSRLRSESTM
jgi:hypothetical protein